MTPLTKKQRLFSPTSPRTPDKSRFHPSSLFSQPSPSDSLADTSTDKINCSVGSGDIQASSGNAVYQSYPAVDSEDVMMCSPPRIERLQLFDYPRTPISIARSSGIHVADSKLRTNRQQRGMNSWNRYMCVVMYSNMYCTVTTYPYRER